MLCIVTALDLCNFPQYCIVLNGVKESSRRGDVTAKAKAFRDREKRKYNLVVHNLPEQLPSGNKERQTGEDIGQFQKLIKDVFGLDVCVTKAFRACARVPNQIRLLIVSLADPNLRYDLVKRAYKLRNAEKWQNIYITADKSKQERDEEKKKRQTLREELHRRTEAGENNLAIRRGKIIRVDGDECRTSQKKARQPQVAVRQPPEENKPLQEVERQHLVDVRPRGAKQPP